ncbi:helix-turn-helix domain-containing protein [Gemmata palustris]|uniref:helix-turn-helix domain-containing protein n=1 Tax=Gemmata palustris TaxID=2822762 RepID=UPI001FE6EB11|nr:transposase family protein [Gemmata palustris]
MIARLENLRKSSVVFGHLTGLTVAAFDALAADVVPAVEAAHKKALERPNRQRAVGGGDDFDLSTADQVLLTVIWLRQYPTNEVLGFLFGVSDSTASPPAPGACRHWSKRAGTRCARPTPARPGAAVAGVARRHARSGGGNRLVRAKDPAPEAPSAGVLFGEEEGPHAQEPSGRR